MVYQFSLTAFSLSQLFLLPDRFLTELLPLNFLNGSGPELRVLRIWNFKRRDSRTFLKEMRVLLWEIYVPFKYISKFYLVKILLNGTEVEFEILERPPDLTDSGSFLQETRGAHKCPFRVYFEVFKSYFLISFRWDKQKILILAILF